MSIRHFAILDPAAGISGDMLLGALVDAGAPLGWLREVPARLGLTDVDLEVSEVLRCGIRGTKVTVRLAGATEGPGDVSDHHHEPGDHDQGHNSAHHHHHGGLHHQHHGNPGPHRHVAELLAIIERSPLSQWVKDRATQAFRLLAEAEGRIHGVAPLEVALHEVGAFDALVDIVAGIEGFEQLGIGTVYTRPVALGNGWVHAAHGVLPVPTPATTLLVQGLAIAPDGPVNGEATTPTGAALLRVLTAGPPPAGWRAVRSGWGAGSRDPERYPNALKLIVAEPAEDLAEVVLLATDVDDLSPEYLEPLREALTAAGALDVQIWATQMKKGRIGFRIEAVAPARRAEEVTRALFRHSTTGGVRRWAAERATLGRELWNLTTPDGDTVRIKTLHTPDGPRVKPEFDDVAAIARKTGQPALELSRQVHEQALRLVRAAAGGHEGGDNGHKES